MGSVYSSGSALHMLYVFGAYALLLSVSFAIREAGCSGIGFVLHVIVGFRFYTVPPRSRKIFLNRGPTLLRFCL